MFRKTTPFILILFVALFASSTLQAQQYARPDQTLSLGTYELLGAATVHEALNEASPNDNDYIFTATPLDQAVVGLSPVTDPQSSASHIIRIRAWGEDRPNSTAEVRLYKDAGATQIAAFPFTIAARRAWADFAFTLSAAQADSITDYGDLRLGIIHDFEANREIRFSWAEFEVPELSAVAPTVINETVVSLLDTSAVLEGEVSDNGGADVTERGVVWDLATNPDPTVDTNLGKSFENPTSPGTGTFQRTASPLDPQTDYKYRMYATNVAGTSYSATGTFTTLQAAPRGAVGGGADAGPDPHLRVRDRDDRRAGRHGDLRWQRPGGRARRGLGFREPAGDRRHLRADGHRCGNVQPAGQ